MMVVGFNPKNSMTQAEAEALVGGAKMQYWDGRVATVTVPATDYTDPITQEVCKRISIVFDAEADPKPVYRIKSYDFIRAAAVP